MNTDQILNTFDPLLTAALERLSKFNKPESKDVARFFGPCFESIARAANLEAAAFTNWLATQSPDTIGRESIQAFVRSLTEAPADERAIAVAIQAQLNRDAALATRPLTEREQVLLERAQPLTERSRDSITAELWEARTGSIRVFDDKTQTYERGEELPGIVWQYLAAREAGLQAELDMRDCRAHGLKYVPASRNKSDLSYLHPMRG